MSKTNRRIPEQSAAIAVRRNGQALEVRLIRKKESKRWGIPKGMVDPGDTHEQTALNEAWEEAGLKGRLLGDAIGTYEYEKWYTTFVVAVYVMEVLESMTSGMRRSSGSADGPRLVRQLRCSWIILFSRSLIVQGALLRMASPNKSMEPMQQCAAHS